MVSVHGRDDREASCKEAIPSRMMEEIASLALKGSLALEITGSSTTTLGVWPECP